jgi:hypothetical protein
VFAATHPCTGSLWRPSWTRLAPVVLAVVAISSCGSDSESEHASADGGRSALTLEVTAPSEVARGGSVVWSLTLANHTDRAIELVCPTGQEAEVGLSRAGATPYRWSEGRFFTQAVRRMLVEPGETSIELQEERLDLSPGEYTLQATVPCEPAPAPAGADVRVISRA